MPTLEQLLPMALLAALILVVPGPTNTLLFSAGLQVGLRRALPLVGAEAAGYGLSILAWGSVLLVVAADRPWLLGGMKWLCALYLLWLAIKLWRCGAARLVAERRSTGRFEVFLATLLNPKAFLFASSVFPLSAFQSVQQFVWFMGVFLLVLVPIGSLWTCLGHLLTLRSAWSMHAGTFLRTASVMLMLFSASIAYSTLDGTDERAEQVALGRILLPMA